ncbi:hypothetical protein G6F63_016932 [Rhizopus arrhizus]|nr:hypothetical protein G6F24_017318 [Rhizopus arrhizus]KAG0756924.1 hypothetical protein G6F22_020132 [Rhizopus arrhizus]KAG1180856.1 hypothetical protein G6F35_016085 [Rhizopus arrhizus]KAG1243213.1 hypothetical protein G6F65_022552 [Rhizopus arrhizus]KAG1294057.1 hypothetical protein G6F63_016932 [Rhizopus arrhizus]
MPSFSSAARSKAITSLAAGTWSAPIWCQRWSSIAAPRYSVVAKPWLNLAAASTLSSSACGIAEPFW